MQRGADTPGPRDSTTASSMSPVCRNSPIRKTIKLYPTQAVFLKIFTANDTQEWNDDFDWLHYLCTKQTETCDGHRTFCKFATSSETTATICQVHVRFPKTSCRCCGIPNRQNSSLRVLSWESRVIRTKRPT